jgi:hypothetical protein
MRRGSASRHAPRLCAMVVKSIAWTVAPEQDQSSLERERSDGSERVPVVQAPVTAITRRWVGW